MFSKVLCPEWECLAHTSTQQMATTKKKKMRKRTRIVKKHRCSCNSKGDLKHKLEFYNFEAFQKNNKKQVHLWPRFLGALDLTPPTLAAPWHRYMAEVLKGQSAASRNGPLPNPASPQSGRRLVPV